MAALWEQFGLTGGGVVSLVGAGGKTSLMFRLARELTGIGQSVLTTTTTKIMRPASTQSPSVLVASSVSDIRHQSRILLQAHPHITAAAFENQPGKLTGYSPETVDALYRGGLFDWIIVEADGASRMPLKAPADHEPVIPSSSGWVVGVAGLDAVGKPVCTPFVFRPERFSEVTGIALGKRVTPASVARLMTHPHGILKGAPAGARKIAFLNKADDPDRIDAGRSISDRLNRPNPPFNGIVVIGTTR